MGRRPLDTIAATGLGNLNVHVVVVPVDGGWSDYGDWSECSKSCGGGERTRSRTCTNPSPADGGAECTGESEEKEACGNDPCAGVFTVGRTT